MYSAVVLDTPSHEKLVEWLNKKFPVVKRDGWEVLAHHMTIQMDELPTYLKDDLDTTHTLEVTGYASDAAVIAVRVTGYFTKNKIPHITLAVNRKNGGKPVMSNNLTNWQPILKPITLKGTVKEIS